jgi:hypothetical protein
MIRTGTIRRLRKLNTFPRDLTSGSLLGIYPQITIKKRNYPQITQIYGAPDVFMWPTFDTGSTQVFAVEDEIFCAERFTDCPLVRFLQKSA